MSTKPLIVRRIRGPMQEPLPFCGAGGPPAWLCCSQGLIYCHLNRVSWCPVHRQDPQVKESWACCRHATIANRSFSCPHHTENEVIGADADEEQETE
jgi:hypothetical protein